MYNETDDIGRLFSKKFENFEVQTSEKEWLDLSSKLGKINFLKFSFVSFNIYYLAILVAFAGATTYTGLKNYQLKKEVKQLEQMIKTSPKNAATKGDSLEVSDTLPSPVLPDVDHLPAKQGTISNADLRPHSESTFAPNTKANPETHNEKPNGENISTKETKSILHESKASVDSIRKDIVVSPVPDTVKVRVKRVKKKLVVKSQTVIVRDTLNSTKP